MNHPDRTQWMSFLYKELDPTTHAEAESHLRSCSRCQAAVTKWQATMSILSAPAQAKVRPMPRMYTQPASFLKWGAAAMLILGAGLGLGRATRAQQDLDVLQARIVPTLREQLQQEMRSDLAAALSPDGSSATNAFRRELRGSVEIWAAQQNAAQMQETRQLLSGLAESVSNERSEDREATVVLIKQLEQKTLAAYSRLKQNLETVAVVADNRFQRNEDQLGQLISYSPSETQ